MNQLTLLSLIRSSAICSSFPVNILISLCLGGVFLSSTPLDLEKSFSHRMATSLFGQESTQSGRVLRTTYK